MCWVIYELLINIANLWLVTLWQLQHHDALLHCTVYFLVKHALGLVLDRADVKISAANLLIELHLNFTRVCQY